MLDFQVGVLRFALLPAIVIGFAIRDGLRDAAVGGARSLRVRLDSVVRVLLFALVIDALGQAAVLHAVHPLGALIAAPLLACAPYLLTRGAADRIARSVLRVALVSAVLALGAREPGSFNLEPIARDMRECQAKLAS